MIRAHFRGSKILGFLRYIKYGHCISDGLNSNARVDTSGNVGVNVDGQMDKRKVGHLFHVMLKQAEHI